MQEKNVRYLNGLGDFTFGAGGFAINPKTLGNAWYAADWRDLLMTVVGTGTVIVYGSAQQNPPDFNAPSTITNSYVPIALVDYSLVGAGAYYLGTTGAVVAGATMLVECDTNLLTWVGIHRSADTVDALLTITNAQ